jgi:hypothetical protein
MRITKSLEVFKDTHEWPTVLPCKRSTVGYLLGSDCGLLWCCVWSPLEQLVPISHSFKYIFNVLWSIYSLMHKVHWRATAQLVTKLAVTTGTDKQSRTTLKAGFHPVELLSIKNLGFNLPSLKRWSLRSPLSTKRSFLKCHTCEALNWRSLCIVWV